MTTIEHEADVCVIGCGPAGAVVASELASKGRRVVVLERGRSYTLRDRARLIRRRIAHLGRAELDDEAPEEERIHAVTRRSGERSYHLRAMTGVGGSSLHWAGYTPRPNEADLRARSAFGYGDDWPFGYEGLEPWLLLAEQHVGVAGGDDNVYASHRSGPFPMPPHPWSHFERDILAPACRALGWTPHTQPVAINSEPYAGRASCRACRHCRACPSGARYSADLVHAPRLRDAPTGRLLEQVNVRRLETSDGGESVAAAHGVRSRDGREVVVRASSFVVAAGGVETPRLLLLSADAKHPDGLGNALGRVGRNFYDHVVLPVSMQLPELLGTRLGFVGLGCEHFRARADRRRHGTFAFLFRPVDYWARDIAERMHERGRLEPAVMRSRLRQTTAGLVTMETTGRGRVDLDPAQTDPYGDPMARISLSPSARDRETADVATGEMDRLGEELAATEVSQGWNDGRWGWGAHPMGACAMAGSPEQGVCDPSLRVFGLRNLYTVSSAVFPHFGAANPTLTIVALALRLAHHLDEAG